MSCNNFVYATSETEQGKYIQSCDSPNLLISNYRTQVKNSCSEVLCFGYRCYQGNYRDWLLVNLQPGQCLMLNHDCTEMEYIATNQDGKVVQSGIGRMKKGLSMCCSPADNIHHDKPCSVNSDTCGQQDLIEICASGKWIDGYLPAVLAGASFVVVLIGAILVMWLFFQNQATARKKEQLFRLASFSR